jgi:small subunit ribosomal protein S16
MLKIRLQKIGKKNDPSYRIALVEHTTSPHGKFIELLGSYNPKLKEKKFDKERIEYWLTKGAQASPTVHNLLVNEKIIGGEKVKAWKPKKRKGEVPPAGGAPTEAGKEPKTEAAPEAEKAEEQKIEEAPKAEEPAKAEEPKIEEVPKEEIKAEVPPASGIPLEDGKAPSLDTEPKKE